jgi:FkbM family methyltransferase
MAGDTVPAGRSPGEARQDTVRRRRRQAWYGLKRPAKRALALPGVNRLAHTVVERRQGAAAAARLPAPLQVREVEGRVDGVTFTMLDPAQCILAKELHWGGGRRPRAQDQFALEVFARLARRSAHILDIGAYTGIFSLCAAKAAPAATVDAFEIVPSNFLACWRNVIANDLVARVDVHLEGVGAPGSIRMPADTRGSALPDFWSVDDHQGQDARTGDEHAEGGQGGEGGSERSARVPVVTLQDVLARVTAGAGGEPGEPAPESAGPVLIKVDVEGHEPALVTEGRRAIEHWRPAFLMEVLPGADVTALVDVFGPAGYHYYLVSEDRLCAADHPRGEDAYRDWLISTDLPADLEALGIPVSPK